MAVVATLSKGYNLEVPGRLALKLTEAGNSRVSCQETCMTERELERQARHRLAVLRHVEEVSGNVSATCRYYGISRNC